MERTLRSAVQTLLSVQEWRQKALSSESKANDLQGVLCRV